MVKGSEQATHCCIPPYLAGALVGLALLTFAADAELRAPQGEERPAEGVSERDASTEAGLAYVRPVENIPAAGLALAAPLGDGRVGLLLLHCDPDVVV